MTPHDEILNEVKRILEIELEGEKYFTKLDEYLTSSATEELYAQLFKLTGNVGIILTGTFGKMIANRIDEKTLPQLDYILFEGGIRKGGKPTLIKKVGTHISYVLIDDSIYAGKTYYALKDFVERYFPATVARCVVAYDGCPIKKEYVTSIFRFYDNFEATPNFKFE